MDSDLKHSILVPLACFLIVAGVIYASFSSPPDMPSGYVVASGVTSCCDDCSCIRQDVCSACGRCTWVSECSALGNSLGPEGMELVHAGRVRDGESFVLNVVLAPEKDGKMLVQLTLPPGFSADRESQVVQLWAGELKIVQFNIHVRENVAEQEHLLKAELLDSNWKVVSQAEAKVGVWWDGSGAEE